MICQSSFKVFATKYNFTIAHCSPLMDPRLKDQFLQMFHFTCSTTNLTRRAKSRRQNLETRSSSSLSHFLDSVDDIRLQLTVDMLTRDWNERWLSTCRVNYLCLLLNVNRLNKLYHHGSNIHGASMTQDFDEHIYPPYYLISIGAPWSVLFRKSPASLMLLFFGRSPWLYFLSMTINKAKQGTPFE